MDIGKIYSLKFKRIIESDEGYIIKLSKSNLILKNVSVPESDVMAACAIIDYLRERGFKNIITIKRNGEGKPYIRDGERLLVLMDFISNDKFKLKTRKNAADMGELLARFHNAGEYFIQPPGIKVPVRWGKKMERCRVFTMQLEKYAKTIKSEAKNPFEEFTLSYIDELIRRARASMKVLRSLDYLNALESSMKRKEICLNSISNYTARVEENRVVIVKVFDMGYNMTEEDVASLIKKAIEECKEKEAFNDVIERYEEYRWLEDKSINIIRALVSYPYDSIKAIIRYTKYPEEQESLLEKFKEYVELEQWTDVMEV